MKVHLRMLGCRLNQAEIDAMARQLQGQGHEIVATPEEADEVIVNTCAVTQEATNGSRKLIREIHRANPTARTNVTGCYAQIAPDDIKGLPGVARVVDNAHKDTLVETLTGQPLPTFDREPIARDEALPGAAGRTRAFVKVQDGCDNACTFCVTTVARGEGRSRRIDEVVQEIRWLHAAGFQEAVLTGVHLGSYGHDLGAHDGLLHLVQAILSDTDLPRLRLSSLEPWDLSPGFFNLWADRRLCRHLHLPLQSGCDATLRRMRRNTSQAGYRTLVAAARVAIPGLSVTTDVIVGFPGETEAEFANSRAFIEEMAFSRLHVFRYSRRPGTPAARMKHHISKADKRARSAALLAHSKAQEAAFARSQIGQTHSVLWEQVIGSTEAGFINVGYTDNYVRVRGVHPRPLTNLITQAVLTDFDAESGQAVCQPMLIADQTMPAT